MVHNVKALSRAKKIGLSMAALLVIGTASAATSPPKTNTPSAMPKNGVLGTETQQPVITTKTVTKTQPIQFQATTVDDPTLAKGTSKITTAGVNGVSTLTYKITYSDGKQTEKELLSQTTTTKPITQVTSVGTYVAPAPVSSDCDPNYTGCVPNVFPSDVDCAGGSGNGPYYTSGPVRVIGVDRYGLDRDGDGIACE